MSWVHAGGGEEGKGEGDEEEGKGEGEERGEEREGGNGDRHEEVD